MISVSGSDLVDRTVLSNIKVRTPQLMFVFVHLSLSFYISVHWTEKTKNDEKEPRIDRSKNIGQSLEATRPSHLSKGREKLKHFLLLIYFISMSLKFHGPRSCETAFLENVEKVKCQKIDATILQMLFKWCPVLLFDATFGRCDS